MMADMIAILSATGSETNVIVKVIKGGVMWEQILVSASGRKYLGLIVSPSIITLMIGTEILAI